MKVLATIIILLSVATCVQAQSLKKHLLPGTLVILAGAAEGVQDALCFHNYSNNPFWGQTSWVNKYRDHNPEKGQSFRGRYLTFTTDGFHLAKFSKDLFLVAAITVKIGDKKKRWYKYIIEGAGYWILNRSAFNLVYNNIKIR